MHFPIIDVYTVTQFNMYTEREREGKPLPSVACCACSILILKSETIEFKSRKASCHVANAFFTRLKLIWPISSLKISKMSNKRVFGKKLHDSMG